MKVIHIAHVLLGGVGSYLDGIAAFQIARYGEDNVRFFVPSSQRDSIPEIPDGCIIPCAYDRRTIGQLYKFMRAGKRAIDSFNPDIVHLHSTFAGALMRLPYLLTVRLRPRVVYCAHGWAFSREDPEWKKLIYAAIERQLARVTDAIVDVSRHELNVSAKHGLPRAISHVVLNGTSNGAPSPAKIGEFDPGLINLLFVGRFDRQKGLDILLEAMRALTDRPVHLYVIGGLVVDSETLPSEAPANVTFLGWLPRQEVGAYYSTADAIVMPSRWEGLSLTAIEAMSRATPVVASNHSSFSEIVISGKTGIIVPELTSDAFTKSIADLDKKQLKIWGDAARERQQEIFSLERQNRELVDLYDDLCSKDKASRSE
jgi:glycosyltransferase involved in cell wall biosynthesis